MVNAGILRGQALNAFGGAVNHIERFTLNSGRTRHFLLASNRQDGETVDREEKVLNLRQFRVELVFGRAAELFGCFTGGNRGNREGAPGPQLLASAS